MNTFETMLKSREASLKIGKIVMDGVRIALSHDFPDITILPNSSTVQVSELQPQGQKLRIVIEAQVYTKAEKKPE